MIEFRSKRIKSSAPGGYGSIDRKGYRRIGVNNKLFREHTLVWRHFNGEIPAGMEIHHKDGDKLNNEIGNLELVDRLTHRHLHAGYEVIDGVIYKRCVTCAEVKLEVQYTRRKAGGLSSSCKKCRAVKAVNDYYRKKCLDAKKDRL